MTKTEKAKSYLKSHPEATTAQVMVEAGCGNSTVCQARSELGIPAPIYNAISEDDIKRTVAYHKKHATCTVKEVVEAIGVTRTIVSKARKRMGWKKKGTTDSDAAAEADFYCQQLDRAVTSRELQEKFGLSRYAASQIRDAYSEEDDSRPETQNRPFDEIDYGPNHDKRNFAVLRMPWSRVGELFGVGA